MSEQIRRKPDNAVHSTANKEADNAADETHAHTSFGETSLSVTPKDVDERDASAQDITERHLQSDDSDERQQEMLDEAIDLSFPASDPPATIGGVTRIDIPKSPTTP
jgi:hypothetical protein